jgi:RHS repeat-associated protein
MFDKFKKVHLPRPQIPPKHTHTIYAVCSVWDKGYRYGFQGQERDSEIGEYYAFEYRIHDTRLGRFLSVDPLYSDYPFYSSYQFASNSPIVAEDIEGLESSKVMNRCENRFKAKIKSWNGGFTLIKVYTQYGTREVTTTTWTMTTEEISIKAPILTFDYSRESRGKNLISNGLKSSKQKKELRKFANTYKEKYGNVMNVVLYSNNNESDPISDNNGAYMTWGEEDRNNMEAKKQMYAEQGIDFNYTIVFGQDKMKEVTIVNKAVQDESEEEKSKEMYSRKYVKMFGIKAVLPFSRKKISGESSNSKNGENKEVKKSKIIWKK